MQKTNPLPPPLTRVILSLVVPLFGAILLTGLGSALLGDPVLAAPTTQSGTSLFLGSVGVISWLMGLRWYRLPGLGLRGNRPLYASIGFAALGWVAFLFVRIFLVSSNEDALVSPDFGQTFLYLILFEAFCVQIWVFGLVFRSLADWRGPLAATATGGLLFGVLAYLFFDESYLLGEPFQVALSSVVFFVIWGFFYGLIRLRTGSILGMVLIQAMQSLTAWHILLPAVSPRNAGELNNFYLAAGIFYAIFIWRLWPTEEEDYRV